MNSTLHKFDYTEADAIVEYITFKPEEHQDKDVKLDSTIFVITGKLQNFKNRQGYKNFMKLPVNRVFGLKNLTNQHFLTVLLYKSRFLRP